MANQIREYYANVAFLGSAPAKAVMVMPAACPPLRESLAQREELTVSELLIQAETQRLLSRKRGGCGAGGGSIF